MHRTLWTITILLALSALGFADTIINFVPNDGSGDNFGATQRSGGTTIGLDAGTDPSYFSAEPYQPGTQIGGVTTLFVGGGFIRMNGVTKGLDGFERGSLTMTTFTLPTNGKDVTIPVTIEFFASLIDPDTGAVFDLGGSANGKIRFHFSDGVYFASAFTTVPEPGTMGLVISGMIGILAFTSKKLNRFSARQNPS
jgi:hypothetical protein